jgi:hypothetical protein
MAEQHSGKAAMRDILRRSNTHRAAKIHLPHIPAVTIMAVTRSDKILPPTSAITNYEQPLAKMRG